MENSFLTEHSIGILESLPEGVYVVDKEFHIVYVNKAASAITGISRDEVIGKICRSFCRSERCEIGCPITEVLRSNKNILDLESTLQSNDGTIIPITLNASLLKNAKDEPVGGIISFRRNFKTDFEDYLIRHPHFYGIIGKSEPMKNIFKSIEQIAVSDATVLIFGETGTGKELIADAIHKTSKRREQLFIKVNCAALPDTLLGSELFGHVKGSFTDAMKDRIGRFEIADGGTIFLDEIGEMSLSMQNQLLRILQEGTFERIGESVTRKVNVRVIAATNKNLVNEIFNHRFRQDLYYRLNVIPIMVPPLRERKEDIPLLAEHFLKKFAQRYNKQIQSISPQALDILLRYEWNGNIRELENAIEYAFVRSKRTDVLCECSLPPHIQNLERCEEHKDIKDIEEDHKTEKLLSLLRQNNWNKTKVARLLGIDRSTIHRRLKDLDQK
ncbi:MAG: sigma 54-interacting transcriptional regulator [Bacteroidota bacterium]|nr:sigma 54-interacting transcriptional regulator [Bacteroidota bacterium]